MGVYQCAQLLDLPCVTMNTCEYRYMPRLIRQAVKIQLFATLGPESGFLAGCLPQVALSPGGFHHQEAPEILNVGLDDILYNRVKPTMRYTSTTFTQ